LIAPHRSLHALGALLLTLMLAACGPATVATAPTATPEPPAATATATAAATPAPTATPPPERVHLLVLEAGSLMIPFAAVEEAFEAANPDIDVELEAHGSIQVIRHVTDLHRPIDVVASADHALLSQLMYQSVNPDTGQPYASWNIRFAGNRVALAFSPTAPGADGLDANNWPEIVSQPRTRLGLADPRFDALGYRQLMVLKLAEQVYGRPHLFTDLLAGRFIAPITAAQAQGHTTIHVPELLEPRPNSTLVLRGSSVQLIPLLQSGDVDYIFEYESVARQHGLQHVVLPDGLNLSTPALNDFYGQVSVQLDFRRFSSIEPVFAGEHIAYGLTIPANAPQPAAAERFIAFLLGAEGQRIMAAHHHPLLSPPTVDHPERLPALLQPLCAAAEAN